VQNCGVVPVPVRPANCACPGSLRPGSLAAVRSHANCACPGSLSNCILTLELCLSLFASLCLSRFAPCPGSLAVAARIVPVPVRSPARSRIVPVPARSNCACPGSLRTRIVPVPVHFPLRGSPSELCMSLFACSPLSHANCACPGLSRFANCACPGSSCAARIVPVPARSRIVPAPARSNCACPGSLLSRFARLCLSRFAVRSGSLPSRFAPLSRPVPVRSRLWRVDAEESVCRIRSGWCPGPPAPPVFCSNVVPVAFLAHEGQ